MEGTTRGLGVGDVLREALRVLGADVGPHVVFGLVGLAMLFAGWFVMAAGILGLGDSVDHAALGFGATGAMVVGRVLGFVLQSAGSTAVACARLRGAPLESGVALRTWLGRLPALAAHVVARLWLELVPSAALAGAAFGVVWALEDEHVALQALVALGAMPVLAALYLVFRAYFGLAFACVADGSGPFEAFGQSVRLLEGRRVAFVVLRLAVVGLYSVASCCLLAGAVGGSGMLFGAVASHVMIALDAVVDACALERVRGRVDASAIARAFE